jgi:uncharacterized membrane protein
MNGAHLHIIVNHVSLFALIFGAVALAASMLRKSTTLRVFAVALFVTAGLFGWIADETGGNAAHIVMEVDNTVRPFIHEHAQAAEFAEGSGVIVALLAIAMEIALRKKEKLGKILQWILLIAAIHGCTVFARTAYLGGLIRHTEIRVNADGNPVTTPLE